MSVRLCGHLWAGDGRAAAGRIPFRLASCTGICGVGRQDWFREYRAGIARLIHRSRVAVGLAAQLVASRLAASAAVVWVALTWMGSLPCAGIRRRSGKSVGKAEPGALVEFEVAALLEATGEGFAHPQPRCAGWPSAAAPAPRKRRRASLLSPRTRTARAVPVNPQRGARDSPGPPGGAVIWQCGSPILQ